LDEIQRARIQEDLSGFFRGELLFDDLSRALYSTDASIFQVLPLGVACPLDEEDAQALVRYAAENRMPLIARGAGTGLAGESLGAGLVVDFSRHLRSISEVTSDTVKVQPGVTYEQLQNHLARFGRHFAPDLAGGVQCTVGGMLATNASGARALKYGYTREHVASLRLVLNNGEMVTVGRQSRWGPTPIGSVRLQELTQGLTDLLEQSSDLIRAHAPRTPFNRCGYLLQDVLMPEYLDWVRLLVGTEGTLAVFTEATLKTLPLSQGRSVVLLGFASLDHALAASRKILETGPSSCELIDRRLVTLARGMGDEARVLIPEAAEAILLVEYECGSQTDADEAGRRLTAQKLLSEYRCVYQVRASDASEIERLWRIREGALPSLYGLRGDSQPVAGVEDVGVPVDCLAHYLRRVQELLRRYDTTASFLIHAGTGQVHARPFLDLSKPEQAAKLCALAEEIHALALEFGGTVSTQHGTGLARTPWVARQYGPLFSVFRDMKNLFDPLQILNPGKIVGSDSGAPTWPLRRTPAYTGYSSPTVFRWQAGEFRAESLNCNGCGHCRTEAFEQRMCPIFRATHAEEATPRSKANLLRQLLLAENGSHTLAAQEVREVADLCVNCRMCALECPAHVNVPKLMLEAKAANVMEHGLNRTDWAMARTEGFSAVASTFSAFANAALANRPTRWLLQKLLGVSAKRRLPRFATRSFLWRAERRGWTQPIRDERAVTYFVDVFANYNDPQIAEAAVAVLRHNGIAVYVPPRQRGCGMAPLAYGDIETAREIAAHNIRILADSARRGHTIVCSEPTAALMLKEDYANLVDDPDAELVARSVVELTSYLWDIYQKGNLRTDLGRLTVSVGHHIPCHVKALGGGAAGPSLLSLIPDMRVRTIDVGCSGMAGTFGLHAENYEVSKQAGGAMLAELSRPMALFGSTECSACRMQMEEGTNKRTLHPIQYLALSYGLMPEIGSRLREPVGNRLLQ
jgi:FAD/FMN-containing dehydrogenase/Fe-S oxidoreductase